MKFKFCADGDCPLWALAALHALASLPAALFRTLLEHVVEEHEEDGIMEILKDTSLSSREECARAAAAIRWVLHQAWRCSCSGTHLTRDLLVIGVPRTHASALADVVDSARGNHVVNAQSNGFSVNRVTGASVSPGPEGMLDTIKLTLFTDDNKRELLIDRSHTKSLIDELKRVYLKMEELGYE